MIGVIFRTMRFPARRHRPLALAVGLLLLSAVGCRSREPIRIGVAGPFTDSVGAPMLRAAQLAADEINAGGGIRGRPIEIVAMNDFGDPDSAVAVAMRMTDTTVVALVGHLYSGTTLAAAPIYGAGGRNGKRPLPIITPSSTAPEVTEAGDHVFRLCPTDLAHGTTLARYVREVLGLRRGAVLFLNNDYGRGFRKTFVQELKNLGGIPVEEDPYLGATPDVGAYLDRIALDRTAEFLVVGGNLEDAETILHEARRRGLNIPLVGGDGLEGIEADPQSDGVLFTAAYLPTLTTTTNRRFVQAYRARYPGAALPNQPAAATYDAFGVLRAILERTRADRRAVLQALTRLGTTDPPLRGATGTLGFDEHGDLREQQVWIAEARRGSVQPAEGQ